MKALKMAAAMEKFEAFIEPQGIWSVFLLYLFLMIIFFN